MPPQNLWKWATINNISLDGITAEAFLNTPENKNRLWKPEVAERDESKDLPRLIFLPGELGLDKEDGTLLTCQELRDQVSQLTTKENPPFAAVDAQLILD